MGTVRLRERGREREGGKERGRERQRIIYIIFPKKILNSMLIAKLIRRADHYSDFILVIQA